MKEIFRFFIVSSKQKKAARKKWILGIIAFFLINYPV